MNYNQRRAYRHRMMRLSVCKNIIKDAVAAIKDLGSESITAAAWVAVVFLVIPIIANCFR